MPKKSFAFIIIISFLVTGSYQTGDAFFLATPTITEINIDNELPIGAKHRGTPPDEKTWNQIIGRSLIRPIPFEHIFAVSASLPGFKTPLLEKLWEANLLERIEKLKSMSRFTDEQGEIML